MATLGHHDTAGNFEHLVALPQDIDFSSSGYDYEFRMPDVAQQAATADSPTRGVPRLNLDE